MPYHIIYMQLSRQLQKYSVKPHNILIKLSNKIRRNNPYDYKYQFIKNWRLLSPEPVKVLVDDAESEITNPNDEFSFDDYSNTIVAIVNGSYQKFSIGVYGGWGTGKTTLMKLVEKKLRPHLFTWENIPGSEDDYLKNFLRLNFDGLNWVDSPNIHFKKSKDKTKITITDTNKTNSVYIKVKDRHKAILEINNQKVYDFFVEKENNNLSIKENNILPVWFNAWRYEREEQFALIPLMKTIAYAMGEHPIYKDIKPILIRGLEILSKDILRNLATRYVMTESGFKEFEEKLIPKMELLPEIDKDTIYFDGIKKIEDEIEKILDQFQNSRIVVFIDDLDRCSPETALEVFESIKVFLEIKGFVFIIGLSREALDKLISAKYEKMGLRDISGEQYIRKIIQIEISLPKWTDIAIEALINKLSNRIDERYRDDIKRNVRLIAKGIELNPRQVKRLINKVVVSLSVKKSLEPRKLIVGELLSYRWPLFYYNISDQLFVNKVREYVEKGVKDREKFIEELEKRIEGKDKTADHLDKIILSYKDDSTLWDFIQTYKETILGKDIETAAEESSAAKDWQRYKKVSESTNFPYIPDASPKVVEIPTPHEATIIVTKARLLHLYETMSNLEQDIRTIVTNSDNRKRLITLAPTILYLTKKFKDDYENTIGEIRQVFPERRESIEELNIRLSALIEELIKCLNNIVDGVREIEKVFADLRQEFEVLMDLAEAPRSREAWLKNGDSQI